MNYKNTRNYLTNISLCVGYGILCGALTGLIIFIFKLGAKYTEELSRFLYSGFKNSPAYILPGFLALIALAFLMSRLHKAVPECKGGGIPRSEGILRGILPFRPLKTLLGTFFGSLLCFLAGVPVGSEGPAVLMGTAVGSLSIGHSKKKTAWNRYIMTGGAGAGFAVATGAPLSGILFALEEIHKRFAPLLVLTVSMSVLSATLVNRLLCTLFHISTELFHITSLPAFELKHIGYLLLLGVLTAFAVGLFDSSILLFRRFTGQSKKQGNIPLKLIVLFLLTGLLGLFLSDGAYSGHHLIEHILSLEMPVVMLIVLFIIRLLMMLLITDSGATGGIFIPTLAIGALFSAVLAKLFIVIGMPEELSVSVILLGMCAFIGGTLRAPLTASVLFLELTGQFTNLFYVALVIFIVSFITELLNQTPFYDKALEEMREVHNHGKQLHISSFELTVSKNSFVVGKAVRDILWPHSSSIVSISRADSSLLEEMDDDGEQRLYAKDKVVLRACYHDLDEILALLQGLVGTDYDITVH